LLYYY